MNFTDEKDYIMRMIKEMVRVLFSLAFGKKYVSVELEKENKYEVSGKNLKIFLNMIDLGQINEAENILLDSIDYTNKNEVMAVALFYQYLSEKDNQFLENNNYTKEEVLSGFKQLLMKSGYRDLLYLKYLRRTCAGDYSRGGCLCGYIADFQKRNILLADWCIKR